MLLSILTLLIIALPLLQTKPVQTWMAQKFVAPYLSEELDTRVEVGSFYLRFNLLDAINLRFRNLVVEELYLEDQQQDTLLYAPRLAASIRSIDLKKAGFRFYRVELEQAYVNLKTLPDSSSSLGFVIRYFSREKADTVRKPFELSSDAVVLNDVTFRYKNTLARGAASGRIDFNDLKVVHLHADIEDFQTDGQHTTASIRSIGLQEKSGFEVVRLSGDFSMSPDNMELSALYLETPNSLIRDYLSFSYSSPHDFSDFEEKVTMQGGFRDSRLSARDLAWFVPDLSGIDLSAGINGDVRGTLNSLTASNFTLYTGQSTWLKGDYRIRGLPDIDRTFFQLDLNTFSTNHRDIAYILDRVSPGKPVELPAFLSEAGNIFFSGEFDGKYNDFQANGELKSSLGQVTGDAHMKFNTPDGIPEYAGSVETPELDVGIISGSKRLGKASFTAAFKGKGFNLDELQQELTAGIRYLDLNGYRYQHVQANGRIDRRTFEGNLKVQDPNLDLDFKGLVNLQSELPEFRFHALVNEADLNALQLVEDSVTIATTLTSNFSGNTLENIQGGFTLDQTTIHADTGSYQIDSISLEASGTRDERLIQIRSDIIDGTMKGQFDITRTPSAVKAVIEKYLPSLRPEGRYALDTLQSFDFDFRLKNLAPVTAAFFPELNIPDEGSFHGHFNSHDEKLNLAGYVETVVYKKITFKDFILSAESQDAFISVNAALDEIALNDSLSLVDVNISNLIKNDSLDFNLLMSSGSGANHFDINALIEVSPERSRFSILPSRVILADQQWEIEKSFNIVYTSEQDLIIDDFTIRNNGQSMNIDGAISRNDSIPLEVRFTNMDVATLNQFARQYRIEPSGIMNGSASVSAVLADPTITGDINISEFALNGVPLGELLISSTWNGDDRSVSFSTSLLKDMQPTMSVSGEVQTGSNPKRLFADAEFNETDLIVLQPLVSRLISGLKGRLTGRVLLEGDLSSPEVHNISYLDFKNAGLKVNYLQTYYTFDHRVPLSGNKITLNGLTLRDVNGNHARVSKGSIDLSDFADPYLDIQLHSDNFQALNTSERDNDLYYGTVYSTGDYSFKGPLSNMSINIVAATTGQSKFYLPLYNPERVGKADFITFVSPGDSTEERAPAKASRVKGLTLNFELDVTKDTEVEIIIDKLAGDRIIGKGDAALQLSINSFGNFEIYGNYDVQSGKYIFTANNLFNKEFDIQPGSNIRFVGDPYEAQLDILANYSISSVRIAPLYEAAGITTQPDGRVKVNSQINLTGTLQNFNADFNIEFPNDPRIRNDLDSYLSNDENRLTQTTWLLLANSFINNNLEQGAVRAGEATITELLSSRLSSMLNEFTGSTNIDLRSRIGTETQEFGGSVRLFEDRLIINGTFVNESDATNPNRREELTQDIEMEYLLNKRGNLRANLFRRSNISDFGLNTNNYLYKHGMGVGYREEFNTFAEFFRNMTGRRKQEQRAAEGSKTASGDSNKRQ